MIVPTSQRPSLAIRCLDLNPRCLQAQALITGNPPDSHLDRRNHPHPQAELAGQNVLRSAPDDDDVSLVTQREKNFPQVGQVAGCLNGLRMEDPGNRILDRRPIALIQTFY
jgi:hypothetical protein